MDERREKAAEGSGNGGKMKEAPSYSAISKKGKKTSVDMNRVVGTCHILFISLDTLLYDVAEQE